MMRITGGALLRRRVLAPPGSATRPATDMLRVALFNMLRKVLHDAVVLDLFAGSGVLSFEALSRGARRAVLLEISGRALDCIRRNAETLGLAERVRALRLDVFRSLPVLLRMDERYDLVFVDPPYALVRDPDGETRLVRTLEKMFFDSDLLAERVVAMVRYPRGDMFLRRLSRLQVLRRRNYGSTEIALLARPGVTVVLGAKHARDRKRGPAPPGN